MVRFFNVTVLLLFWQFGKITHSLLPLVVTVAVQVMHLLAAGRIEVQLVELQDGPGDTVEGLHALRDRCLYDFAAGHQMIPVVLGLASVTSPCFMVQRMSATNSLRDGI